MQDAKLPALMVEIMKCWKTIMLENMKNQGEFIGAKTVIYVSQPWCKLNLKEMRNLDKR